MPLAGRPMVEWSIAAFRAASIATVVVACPPGHALGESEGSGVLGESEGSGVLGESEGSVAPGESAGAGANARVDEDESKSRDDGPARAALRTVEGGETRSESVANALAEVKTELVAIHDAARPLVTASLIEEVVGALLADPDAAGAIAAAPITDTVKQATGSSRGAPSKGRVADLPAPGRQNPPLVIVRTLDRDRLWAAQTPQVFRVEALRAAVDAGGNEAAPTSGKEAGPATDEAMLVEAAGGRVLICPAPPENLKVTTPRDLRLAEQLLAERRAEERRAEGEAEGSAK